MGCLTTAWGPVSVKRRQSLSSELDVFFLIPVKLISESNFVKQYRVQNQEYIFFRSLTALSRFFKG